LSLRREEPAVAVADQSAVERRDSTIAQHEIVGRVTPDRHPLLRDLEPLAALATDSNVETDHAVVSIYARPAADVSRCRTRPLIREMDVVSVAADRANVAAALHPAHRIVEAPVRLEPGRERRRGADVAIGGPCDLARGGHRARAAEAQVDLVEVGGDPQPD